MLTFFLKNIINKIQNKSFHHKGDDENLTIKIAKKNNSLRNLLRYARQYSPWYKKLLKDVPIESISYEDLSDLPTLTKHTLMDNWDEIVTDRSLNLKKVMHHLDKMNYTDEIIPLDEKYIVFSTGGSSGRKGILVREIENYRKAVYYTNLNVKKKMYELIKLEKNEKIRTVQVIITNAVYMMHARAKIYKPEDEIIYHLPINQPIDEIVKKLNDIQPHRIIALPSTIYYLCLSVRSGDLRIKPNIITVGAEPLFPPIKRLIYETWPHVKLFNIYGATEGIVAQSCFCDNNYMHIYDQGGIISPVDKFNRSVEMNGYSDKLIFTNFSNYTLPLINYEIDDRLRFVSKTCSCGSTFPLIEEPKGRPANDFFYPDNIMIHHLIFVTPLLTDGHVVEYQVTQTRQGAIIKIVSSGPVKKDNIINKICEDYLKLGIKDAQIKIIDVPQLEYLHSGKMRRFICLQN